MKYGILQGLKQAPVDEIVIHCADTRPDWMVGERLAEKVKEIRRWHVRDRGWADIGYHYVIDRDGQIATGRAETVIGAGVAGHNTGVLHLCLLGGYGAAATDSFSENFTTYQDASLRLLIESIKKRTPIRRVSGHNEWAAKACPGFNVPKWLLRTEK